MNSTEFSGKAAFITGAGSGIGAAAAILLAERGAAVALLGRRKDKLDDVAARIRQAAARWPSPATSACHLTSSGPSITPSRSSAPCITASTTPA